MGKLEIKQETKPIIPLQKPRNSGRPTWKLPGKPEPTNQMWAQTIEQDPPEIQMQQNNNVNAPLEPAKACRVLIHKPSVSNNKKQMMNDFYLLWDRGNVTCSRTDIIFEPREGSSFYHKRKRKLQERLAKEEQAKLEQQQQQALQQQQQQMQQQMNINNPLQVP